MPDIYINPEDKPKKSPKKLKKIIKKQIIPDNVEGLPGHNHNPLSSYCYFPHHVNFINQEPDEKIVLLVRRHVITNLGWIILVILMSFAPGVLKTFPLLDFLPARFQMVAILIWYLLTLAIAIQGFLSWFFSVNIITNKRVIDVDFDNLIYRKITDAEITHIEDATVQMGSVVRTLFNFGDIVIQTAAEIPEVTFDAVPYPDRIDKILSELRMEAEDR
ncbi:MAG TPA: hypothetical protein VLE44_01905 [Candidatus Saccharimonadales bacterium]|nr:hypothetical protein [Candidatus Saccharimonadales bacterium]